MGKDVLIVIVTYIVLGRGVSLKNDGLENLFVTDFTDVFRKQIEVLERIPCCVVSGKVHYQESFFYICLQTIVENGTEKQPDNRWDLSTAGCIYRENLRENDDS